MDVYSNPQFVGHFIKGIEEWVNLGRPRITDYHVEFIDPAELDDSASLMYIDKRPNATLRFSLEENAI